jgi:hypothetical protein
MLRSKKGCWSSISSSVRACIEPSWVRRAWTGSTEREPARPMKMRMIPAAATSAMMRGRFMA